MLMKLILTLLMLTFNLLLKHAIDARSAESEAGDAADAAIQAADVDANEADSDFADLQQCKQR